MAETTQPKDKQEKTRKKLEEQLRTAQNVAAKANDLTISTIDERHREAVLLLTVNGAALVLIAPYVQLQELHYLLRMLLVIPIISFTASLIFAHRAISWATNAKAAYVIWYGMKQMHDERIEAVTDEMIEKADECANEEINKLDTLHPTITRWFSAGVVSMAALVIAQILLPDYL